MAIFSWICALKWPERMQCCAAAQWEAGSPCSVHLIIAKWRSSVCSRLLIDECIGEFLCGYLYWGGGRFKKCVCVGRNPLGLLQAATTGMGIWFAKQSLGLLLISWTSLVTKDAISRPACSFGEEIAVWAQREQAEVAGSCLALPSPSF